MTEELNENVLEDNYPLHYGYLYVVGDKVFQNWPDFKTVAHMRNELILCGLEKEGVVIKSCDISGRDLWDLAV